MQQIAKVNTSTKHPVSVLKRLLTILNAIKNTKGRAGTKEISDFLKANGIDVSLRTIQRDLRVMRDFGVPIEGDDCKPQGWRIDTQNPLYEAFELLSAA